MAILRWRCMARTITPNQHTLALQFGVLDNFYDSAEVSGDGHVWSNAAIGTDYLEETWQQNYRGGQRTYDYEGMVADGYPLLQHIPDVDEPESGYIWSDMVAHGRTIYHFGEYISSVFCGDKAEKRTPINPQQGAMSGAGGVRDSRRSSRGRRFPRCGAGGRTFGRGRFLGWRITWRPSRSWWGTLRRSRRTSI